MTSSTLAVSRINQKDRGEPLQNLLCVRRAVNGGHVLSPVTHPPSKPEPCPESHGVTLFLQPLSAPKCPPSHPSYLPSLAHREHSLVLPFTLPAQTVHRSGGSKGQSPTGMMAAK